MPPEIAKFPSLQKFTFVQTARFSGAAKAMPSAAQRAAPHRGKENHEPILPLLL
jgi:hypothetical protein